MARYKMSSLFFFLNLLLIAGCSSRVYSDEKMKIDQPYLAIFNAVVRKDTFFFISKGGLKRSFIIGQVDSVVHNEKGWLMNKKPYKLVKMTFSEIGDSLILNLERYNEMFVNKNPETGVNSLLIQFNNFYYLQDSLPQKRIGPTYLNEKICMDCYILETSDTIKNQGDIKRLYLNTQVGFWGFQTKSGEGWVREE